MMDWIRHLLRRDEGSSLVEVAAILPFLAVAMIGLSDYGIALYSKSKLTSAVRSGAQFAMVDPTDTVMIQEIVSSSSGVDPSELTINLTAFCECSDGTAITCDATCPEGEPLNEFLRISADRNYTPLFLPDQAISSSMTLRVE